MADVDSLCLQLAEAELAYATALQGLSFALNLSHKMGMVVNPNGEISKVTDGGQAAMAGVRPGCRLLNAGGSKITSLADLKQAIAIAKAAATSITESEEGVSSHSLEVVLSDPRRVAKTAAEVARLKAAQADTIAAEAIAIAAESAQRAETEARRVEELRAENAAANEKAHEAAAHAREERVRAAEEAKRMREEENAKALKHSKEVARKEREADAALSSHRGEVVSQQSKEEAEAIARAAKEEAARVRAEEEEAAMKRRGGKRAKHVALINKKDSWSESESESERAGVEEGLSNAERTAFEERKAAAAAQAAKEAAANRAAKKKKLEEKRAAAAEAKMTPMERAHHHVAQAQVALEAAQHGLDALLRLDQGPLGLVLNPDGRITQVRDGGAAAEAGLAPGSRLVSLGSRNKVKVTTASTAVTVPCSLADLKKAVQEAKARGDTSLQVTVQDPKAVARAASRLGQCKVEVAQVEAFEAVAAAAEAEAKAAEEASKAAELYAANEGERHMEHARSHPNAFARDVLQVLMEERLNEDIKNDFAEEMVWLTLVNELASAAVLRDHEDERSFTEGVQLVLRDLTEESLEVEVVEVASAAIADDQLEWAGIETCTIELWLEGLSEALVEVAADTVEGEWRFLRATALVSADIVTEVLMEEVSSSVEHGRELERSFLAASTLAGDALLKNVLEECVLEEATAAVEDQRCTRSACRLVAQELWAEIVGVCANYGGNGYAINKQGEIDHNQCTTMMVGSEPLKVASEVREAHYAAEAKDVFQEILEEVLDLLVYVEAEEEAALAEREVPRRARSFNTSNTISQGGGPLPTLQVKPQEQAWIASMRAEARTQSLARLKADNVYREQRAAVAATMARHQIEARTQRAVLTHWKQQQQKKLTEQSAAAEEHTSLDNLLLRGDRNKSLQLLSMDPFVRVLRHQQQLQHSQAPSTSDAEDESQLPPLTPVGSSVAGSVRFDGSSSVATAPKSIADLLALAARGDDAWLHVIDKAPAIEPPPLPPPPPPLPTSPPSHVYHGSLSGHGSSTGHDGSFDDGRDDGSATQALRQRRIAQLHHVSALRRNYGRCARARAHAERAAANAAQIRNQAQARADKLRNLLSATESLSRSAYLAISAAITAGVASVVEADGGPRSPLPLSQRLSSSRVDSLHYTSTERLQSPKKGSVDSDNFHESLLDASSAHTNRSSKSNLQEQYAVAADALNEAESALLKSLGVSAQARLEHEYTAAELEDAQDTLASLGELLKEVNRVAADFEKSGGGRKHSGSIRNDSPSKFPSSLAKSNSNTSLVETKPMPKELLATGAVSSRNLSPHCAHKKSNRKNIKSKSSATKLSRKAAMSLGTATLPRTKYPNKNEALSHSAAGMAAVAELEASERAEGQRHRRAEATFLVPEAIKQSPLAVHPGF